MEFSNSFPAFSVLHVVYTSLHIIASIPLYTIAIHYTP